MAKLRVATSTYNKSGGAKMGKKVSIRTHELFVDFLRLRRRTLDRVWATTSYKTPIEVVKLLEDSELNEFAILKERARLISFHVSQDFLLSSAWWQEQGIDFDLSCKIVP